MTEKQHRIQALIDSIINYLQAHRVDAPGVDQILDKLAGMDLSAERFRDTTPQGTRHDEVLKNAIAGITAPELYEIGINLAAAKDDLIWLEDKGLFYPRGTDVGDGYKSVICILH